jgi:hypothetical protein
MCLWLGKRDHEKNREIRVVSQVQKSMVRAKSNR